MSSGPTRSDGAPAAWFPDFEWRQFEIQGSRVAARVPRTAPGDRPVLLLLHGFPQTHVMWHRVAQRLQNDFYLVLPDLRGYGDSDHEPGLPDHSNYSKRAMATDLVRLMQTLGIERFGLCGHDRGGRVAHRLALDHPQRVSRLCLMDIAPTLDMYEATDMNFARAYYHWFHLIQPTPLPEPMIGGAAKAYLHATLGGWGSASSLNHIEGAALAEYERCVCRPDAIHRACEDYRASAGIDLEHDRESRLNGQRIACETLLIWGSRGVVHRLFKPLALWQAQCDAQVSGCLLDCGHFLPEEQPEATTLELQRFFSMMAPHGSPACTH